MKKLLLILLALVVLVVAVPLVNLGYSAVKRGRLAALRGGDAEFAKVAAVLEQKCACCHTEGASLPFYARLPVAGQGVLFDGSTRAGSSPVRWNGGTWKTAATASISANVGGWQTHSFVFGADSPPLGGFILGANVATQEALACEVAEVLVYPRALSATELTAVSAYFTAKWGTPAELPAAQQPQPSSAHGLRH